MILYFLNKISLLIFSFFKRFILNTINTYLKYEAVTQIKVVRVREMVFPAVYICNNPGQYSFTLVARFNDEFVDLMNQNIDGQECVVFNNGRNSSGHKVDLLKTKDIGKNLGLKLSLYLGSAGENLVKVFIGENRVLPRGKEVFKLLAEQGKVNDISVSKTIDTKLPYPYNDCLDDLGSINYFGSEFYRLTLKNGYKYRQANCYEVCTYQAIAEHCNCTSNYYPTNSTTEDCNSKSKYLCKTIFANKYRLTKKCLDSCPSECRSTSFKYNTVPLDYVPTEEEILKLRKRYWFFSGKTNSALIKELNTYGIYLRIFFDELTYTEIIETPKTTGTDLVSNIGGTLGKYK